MKRGYDLGRFDQFWDDDTLFRCRYSRSKWLHLGKNSAASVPLDIYSHYLRRNKNIIHITFDHTGFSSSFSDVERFQATICDLPWTSVFGLLPTMHRDPLYIKSPSSDLITFAEEIRLKLDPFSTYIFTEAGYLDLDLLPGSLGNNAIVLISFVPPISGQSLILRLKHSGSENGPLEITLGSNKIELNPSSKSSLTIDDINLYPIPGPSDHLSFEPGIRSDIVIQFRRTVIGHWHGHFLHDVELLDEAGLEDPRNQIINID